MKYSIVPEMITSQRIKFLDERGIEVTLCKKSPFKYLTPFQKPFLVVDSFARKTGKPEEIINMNLEELRKMGFILTSIKAGKHRWFSGQLIIYRIEPLSNISPGSKRITNLPNYHKIVKDIANNKIKLVGPNAGFPHRGNGGNWIEVKEHYGK